MLQIVLRLRVARVTSRGPWLVLALAEAGLTTSCGLRLRALLLVVVRAAGPPLLEPLDQRHVQHDHVVVVVVVLLSRTNSSTATTTARRCSTQAPHPNPC